MDVALGFIIYLTLFRLAIIGAGVISIVLGYRLLCKGIFPARTKEASFEAKIAGSSFSIKSAAPGTFFALFGVIIISTMLARGNPAMSLESPKNLLREEGGKDTNLHWTMRGNELNTSNQDVSLKTLTSKALSYEKAQNIGKAVEAYEELLALIASPMKNLAVLYSEQGKLAESENLARLAIQMNPDNASFQAALAEILFRAGKKVEAADTMDKAASLDPFNYKQKAGDLRKSR